MGPLTRRPVLPLSTGREGPQGTEWRQLAPWSCASPWLRLSHHRPVPPLDCSLQVPEPLVRRVAPIRRQLIDHHIARLIDSALIVVHRPSREVPWHELWRLASSNWMTHQTSQRHDGLARTRKSPPTATGRRATAIIPGRWLVALALRRGGESTFRHCSSGTAQTAICPRGKERAQCGTCWQPTSLSWVCSSP